MQKVKIFGVDVLAGKREELFGAAAELIGIGGAISTVNPEILANSLENDELRSALCDSLCIPDGVGVEMTLRRLGDLAERFPGVELGEALLSVFAVRLGIIGGREGVAERAAKNLAEKYPSSSPVMTISGYGINNEDVIAAIREAKPDVVFVCLGSPKQEIFIKEIKDSCDGVLFVALGGAVDVYSGDKKRAPRLFRALRCEWLYRIIKEPSRIKRLPKLVRYVRESRKKYGFHKKLGKIFKKGEKSA